VPRGAPEATVRQELPCLRGEHGAGPAVLHDERRLAQHLGLRHPGHGNRVRGQFAELLDGDGRARREGLDAQRGEHLGRQFARARGADLRLKEGSTAGCFDERLSNGAAGRHRLDVHTVQDRMELLARGEPDLVPGRPSGARQRNGDGRARLPMLAKRILMPVTHIPADDRISSTDSKSSTDNIFVCTRPWRPNRSLLG
jgi:hypothetical protein